MADITPVQSTVAPAAASSAAPGSSSVPASQPAGSVAAPPAASLEDNVGFRQLREQYETTKAERERLAAENEKWAKLGDYEQVAQFHGTFQQRITQATALGKSLGYTDQQIREAMMKDPHGTELYLQQEAQKPATLTREQQTQQIEKMLQEKVQPLQERFDETVNREANVLYETERDRLYKTEFADGLPDANKEELFEILDGLVASDAAALTRLKFQHQVSDIKRHMDQAKTVFLKRHNEYIAHERGKTHPRDPKTGKPRDEETGSFMTRKLSIGGTVKELLGV